MLGMSLRSAAQQKNDLVSQSTPKIGVVLSGGGAKGFAHIGVLKVLEEAGIRPDYITGTSMGSIVAGLYALGYSAEELETLVVAADWNDLLTDKITLKDIPIFNKDDYPGYPLKMEFLKGAKLSLPTGMIKGQKIQDLLTELTWPSHAYDSFDDFPIPYRCVATDVISGKPVVFKDGNLAEAMRASMSIPTVFAAVEKDTMLLIDGGMTINYPVQECLDMGADIIIGVYTGFDENPKKEDLRSMVKILARSSALQSITDARIQMEKTDVYILPELGNLGAENFNKAKNIIDAGELAARDSVVFESMKRLGQLQQPKLRFSASMDTTSIFITTIVVEGNRGFDSNTIIKLSGLEKSSYMNAQLIDKGIKKLYATCQFNQVSYQIQRSNEENTLILKVDEGARGYLSLGLHYDNAYGPNALFHVAFKDFLIHSTKAIAKVSISANPRGLLSYQYYPTKTKKLAISLNTYGQVTKMPDIITEEDITYTLGHFLISEVDFNAALSWSPLKNTMLQVRAGRQFNKIKLKEGMETFYKVDQVNYNLSYIDFSLLVHTLDDPYFPTKGTYLNLSYKETFDAEFKETDTTNFFGGLPTTNAIVTLDFRHYFLILKKLSIAPEMTIGLMNNEVFLTEKYFLGGNTYNLRPNYYNCGGIRSNYLATDNFMTVGINFQFKFLRQWYASYSAQQTIFFDHSDIESPEEEEFENYTFGSWSAGLGFYSKIGPLRLIISKSPQRNEYVWYLNLGVPF